MDEETKTALELLGLLSRRGELGGKFAGRLIDGIIEVRGDA